MSRRCVICPGRLTPGARADARYCSTRCRVAAHRARSRPPRELTARTHWVRYSARKVPLTTDGTPASATDPVTWTTYDAARRASAGAGLGYVLAPGDGIVCVDLDDCLNGQDLAPWAARILKECPSTYVEVSPSGRGLHIWGRGHLERGRRIRRSDGAKIEAYGQGRYITVTGRRWKSAPARLADVSGALAALLESR